MVVPSTSKLDIDRLRKDIPKYYAYLIPQSAVIWDNFLEQQLNALIKESSPTEYQFQFRQLIAAGSKRAAKSPQPEVSTREDSSSNAEEEVQNLALSVHPTVNINVHP
jgi:hypothetical protein